MFSGKCIENLNNLTKWEYQICLDWGVTYFIPLMKKC